MFSDAPGLSLKLKSKGNLSNENPQKSEINLYYTDRLKLTNSLNL